MESGFLKWAWPPWHEKGKAEPRTDMTQNNWANLNRFGCRRVVTKRNVGGLAQKGMNRKTPHATGQGRNKDKQKTGGLVMNKERFF